MWLLCSFSFASKFFNTSGSPGPKSYMWLYFPFWWSSQSSGPASTFTLFTFSKKKKVFKWLHPIMKLKERIKVKPLAYFLLAKIFLLVKKTLFLPFSFFLNYWKFVFWPLICVIQDKGWDSTKSLIVRYKKCLKYIYDVFSWTFCFKRKFYCVVHLSGADIPFFPLYKQRIQCIFYILNNKIYVIK